MSPPAGGRSPVRVCVRARPAHPGPAKRTRDQSQHAALSDRCSLEQDDCLNRNNVLKPDDEDWWKEIKLTSCKVFRLRGMTAQQGSDLAEQIEREPFTVRRRHRLPAEGPGKLLRLNSPPLQSFSCVYLQENDNGMPADHCC